MKINRILQWIVIIPLFIVFYPFVKEAVRRKLKKDKKSIKYNKNNNLI